MNTNNIVMWKTLQNNADWDCFKTPILQEILRIQNLSTSGGTLCIFGSHTFVPISWLCQKQISVSHSSTESESISLDAGLRDDFTAFNLWNLIDEVLGNTNQSNGARRDLCTNRCEVRSTPHTIQKRNQSHGMTNDLDNDDFIPSNVNSSHQEALFVVRV